MGRRSATETLSGLIAAFIQRRTWNQAELAKQLETTTETVRKRLLELQAAGFKIERELDAPHVYWSVPKNWLPGALAFQAGEVPNLVRLLSRAPKTELREKYRALILTRLGGALSPDFQVEAASSDIGEHEQVLNLIEDAASGRTVAKIRYFTASRGQESHRLVSVHRVELGASAQFIATCHNSQTLKRFRVSSVATAMLVPEETFLAVAPNKLSAFIEASLGGFGSDGPAELTSFVVSQPTATWVTRNLPDARISVEPDPKKNLVRFRLQTGAVTQLARYVVGLGAAARAESPELRRLVRELAEGALRP